MRLFVSSRIALALGLLIALVPLGCSEEHAAEATLELPLVEPGDGEELESLFSLLVEESEASSIAR